MLAAFALVPAFPAIAPADGLCNYPGHTAWSLNGDHVESAVWLHNVTLINVHSTPPTATLLYTDLSDARTLATAAGNIIRAELYACNSVVGSSQSYAGTYLFRDTGPQPNWNSRDRVGFDGAHVNIPVQVGRYFQQVGTNAGYKIEPLLYREETIVATGPGLLVTDSGGSVPSADTRGPANGGNCGNLNPGQYEAQIAEEGHRDEGVWDNNKGGTIRSLSYDTVRNRIRVTLRTPDNKDPLRFQVGDPVTIEGAHPAAYNGDWKVVDVSSPLKFQTTGPSRLHLGSGQGGQAVRYYASGAGLPRGISLSGWVEICAGTAGTYYATEKLEPAHTTPPMLTVRWESESRISIPANTPVRVRWYQMMPCKESGDLKMWPRVVVNPGVHPDANIVAEGDAFVFHVVDSLPSRCETSRSRLPGTRMSFANGSAGMRHGPPAPRAR